MDVNDDTSSADRQHGDQTGISEEDARKFLEQLRAAPAEEVIADVFSTLLNAAQVKLGRRDARLFIDLCAVVLEHARPYASDELGDQVEKALGQLRLGQVSAESHKAKQDEPEPNDLSRLPTPPATGVRKEASAGDQSASPSSRLWVPGR